MPFKVNLEPYVKKPHLILSQHPKILNFCSISIQTSPDAYVTSKASPVGGVVSLEVLTEPLYNLGLAEVTEDALIEVGAEPAFVVVVLVVGVHGHFPYT